MSRNEKEEEEKLFVFTVFFCVKAYHLLRETVVREGISGGEVRVIKILSRVMRRGFKNVKLSSPSFVIVVSLGKSIHHCIPLLLLRMINSLKLSFLKQKEQ